MINRRNFLTGILIGCSAPAIVRASSLMKIVVPSQEILSLQDLAFNTGAYEEIGKALAELMYKESNRQGFARRFLRRSELETDRQITDDFYVWTPEKESHAIKVAQSLSLEGMIL